MEYVNGNFSTEALSMKLRKDDTGNKKAAFKNF